MPYITKYNLFRIIRDFEFEVEEELLEGLYYKYPFLSNKEIKYLAKYQSFLENYDDANLRYRKIKRNEDFVFQSKPSFHYKKDCDLLKSDFINLYMPDKIIELGGLAKKLFIKWAEDKKKLFLENFDEFKTQACKKFRSYDLLPKDFIDCYAENTGTIFKKQYNIKSIEIEIKRLIKEAKAFYYASEDHKIVLSRYKQRKYFYKSKYDFEDPDYTTASVKSVLRKQSLDFEEPIIGLHKELLRIMFNPNLSFNKNLLIELGFKKCQNCHSSTLLNSDFLSESLSPIRKKTKTQIQTSSKITLGYFKDGYTPEEILAIRINDIRPITSLRTIEDHIYEEIEELSDAEIRKCYTKREERYMLSVLKKKKKIIGFSGAMDLLHEMDISYFSLKMFLSQHPEIIIIPKKIV
jgi:hypothetical protein